MSFAQIKIANDYIIFTVSYLLWIQKFKQYTIVHIDKLVLFITINHSKLRIQCRGSVYDWKLSQNKKLLFIDLTKTARKHQKKNWTPQGFRFITVNPLLFGSLREEKKLFWVIPFQNKKKKVSVKKNHFYEEIWKSKRYLYGSCRF